MTARAPEENKQSFKFSYYHIRFYLLGNPCIISPIADKKGKQIVAGYRKAQEKNGAGIFPGGLDLLKKRKPNTDFSVFMK